jgi:predicted  nucleic acid-binding Zn-ribbon protein
MSEGAAITAVVGAAVGFLANWALQQKKQSGATAEAAKAFEAARALEADLRTQIAAGQLEVETLKSKAAILDAEIATVRSQLDVAKTKLNEEFLSKGLSADEIAAAFNSLG